MRGPEKSFTGRQVAGHTARMPIRWKISHADRMVTVEIEDDISLAEAEEYLDAVVVADAMPYAKLLDCTAMETHVSDDEMMRLGARMRAYASEMKGGPLVFIVTKPDLHDYVLRYINLAAADRPVCIVETIDQARAWLEQHTW